MLFLASCYDKQKYIIKMLHYDYTPCMGSILLEL